MPAKKKEKSEAKKSERPDFRSVEDLREIKIKVGVLSRADGSCYLEWGQNKVIAAVYGPRECLPKHFSNPYKAVVRYYYRMATFSVPDRKNPKPGRRDIEISKVSGEALEKAVFLERFPGTAIDVFVEILDSNAGTRIAGLTAASVALADAGIPLKDLVVGITVGKANGKLVVDLVKEEEDAEDAVDLALAVLANSKEVVLLQMDGLLKKEEWLQLQEMALNAASKVYELQKQALLEKYNALGKNGENAVRQEEEVER